MASLNKTSFTFYNITCLLLQRVRAGGESAGSSPREHCLSRARGVRESHSGIVPGSRLRLLPSVSWLHEAGKLLFYWHREEPIESITKVHNKPYFSMHFYWNRMCGPLHIWKEGNVLFNDSLNTFYLRLCGIRHMVKDHSDS